MVTSPFEKPDDYVEADRLNILYSEGVIAQRLEELAIQIASNHEQEFLIIGLLKGSFVFVADLVRALHKANCTPHIDFLTLSSYGDAKQSSGNVITKQILSDDVKGKRVVLVDDILESGRTLHHAKNMVMEQGAAHVEVCVLLDKPGKRKEHLNADYTGFVIPDKFVVGYGLDYAGYYRELPFIGTLD